MLVRVCDVRWHCAAHCAHAARHDPAVTMLTFNGKKVEATVRRIQACAGGNFQMLPHRAGEFPTCLLFIIGSMGQQFMGEGNYIF